MHEGGIFCPLKGCGDAILNVPPAPMPPLPPGTGVGAGTAAAAAALAAAPPQIIECLTCERRFCRCCNLESLDGRCPREEGKNEDALAALIESEGMKRCPFPTCGIPTAKESGCNRVYCRACKKNWCWLCCELTGGEGLPQNIKYAHWRKKGSKCRLWPAKERKKQQQQHQQQQPPKAGGRRR